MKEKLLHYKNKKAAIFIYGSSVKEKDYKGVRQSYSKLLD
jgi:hypothetical protein